MRNYLERTSNHFEGIDLHYSMKWSNPTEPKISTAIPLSRSQRVTRPARPTVHQPASQWTSEPNVVMSFCPNKGRKYIKWTTTARNPFRNKNVDRWIVVLDRWVAGWVDGWIAGWLGRVELSGRLVGEKNRSVSWIKFILDEMPYILCSAHIALAAAATAALLLLLLLLLNDWWEFVLFFHPFQVLRRYMYHTHTVMELDDRNMSKQKIHMKMLHFDWTERVEPGCSRGYSTWMGCYHSINPFTMCDEELVSCCVIGLHEVRVLRKYQE